VFTNANYVADSSQSHAIATLLFDGRCVWPFQNVPKLWRYV